MKAWVWSQNPWGKKAVCRNWRNGSAGKRTSHKHQGLRGAWDHLNLIPQHQHKELCMATHIYKPSTMESRESLGAPETSKSLPQGKTPLAFTCCTHGAYVSTHTCTYTLYTHHIHMKLGIVGCWGRLAGQPIQPNQRGQGQWETLFSKSKCIAPKEQQILQVVLYPPHAQINICTHTWTHKEKQNQKLRQIFYLYSL